jgi:hypothetical protein
MTGSQSLLPVWLALAVFLGGVANAQETSPKASPARYVTINVEIHGLEESGRILKGAAQALASTLEDLQSRRKDLTPEQLDRLVAVAKEMNEVARALERTLKESGSTIENARGPAKAIVADVLSTARDAGIDPVLRSIHWSVTTWLVIAIAGGLAALLLTLFAFFSIGRQLKYMVATLKSLADEYELVRRAAPRAER